MEMIGFYPAELIGRIHSGLKYQADEKGLSFRLDLDDNLKDIAVNSLLEANMLANEDITWLNILVAEDNAMNIMLMKKLLTSWNVNADFALNGLEACEMAKEKFYDIILMDIHMPIMDGYESTANIISFYEDKPQVPYIIALTASVANDIYNKIKLAGLNDYVSKPFNPTELKNKLISLARLKSK